MMSVADSPFEKGAEYCKTRLLPLSATQRLPLGSNAKPTGPFRTFSVGKRPGNHVVKFDCPITTVADSPVENGVVYSRTRLLPASATQRFPFESNRRPVGKRKPFAVVVLVLVVKLDWPITRVADSPFEKGGTNSRIRLLPSSATHMLPAESNDRPNGKYKPFAVVAGGWAVKFR
jgi:hypothetical protein